MDKPRAQKRGDQKPAFTERDTKIFETVLANYIEIVELVVSRSILALSTNRITRLDYKICVETVLKKAELNRGMQKSLRKILLGEPCGVGSRNALVIKLTPLFLAAKLFPMGRFFCPSDAWADKCKKQRENLKLSMTTKQVKSVAEKYFDSNTARHFGEEGPSLVIAEPWEPVPQPETAPIEPQVDVEAYANMIERVDTAAFDRQHTSA